MPSLDPLRRRISVTEEQLELLRLLSSGELDHRSPAVAGLREAGLVTPAGAVHTLVSDLADAMVRPELELWIETMSPRGSTVSHVVVREDEDLWYTDPWPGAGGDDEVVFVKDERPRLLWVLARLVGLRRCAPPASARPVTARLVSVASVLGALAAESDGSWDDVRAVVIAGLEDIFCPLSHDQREMWTAVLATLAGTWRITCAWGPEERHSRGLAVWDCGAGGFWRRTTSVEPLLSELVLAEGEATFAPVSGDDLWRALAQLLPSRAELLESADVVAHGGGGAR